MTWLRQAGRVTKRFAAERNDTKYARRERERRSLLSAPAPGSVLRQVEITDRYIRGTRLRLRRSITSDGDGTDVGYKLTQKVPSVSGGPGLITTIYLTGDEYEVFAQLPAAVLHKTRRSVPPLGVDVFEGRLVGLILAEAEFDTDEAMGSFVSPPFAVAEITDDLRFTGGYLVEAARIDVEAALQGFGIALTHAPGSAVR